MANGNAKNFELKIGKTGLLIVLAGMTALLCAAFLFGMDVGQNMDTYPEKIALIPQQALALVWRPAKIRMTQQNAAENSTGQNQAASAPDSTDAPIEENIDLTYHKTLTSKKGMENTDSFVEKQSVNATTISEEEAQKGKFNIETNIPTVTKKQSVPEKEDVKKKETVKQTESAKPGKISEESPPVKEKFIVQVASLKDRSKAYQMNKQIASLGFQSKIIKTEIKGKGIVFRVVVSDLNDREQAQQAAKKISAKTGENCIVKRTGNNIKEN